MSGQNRIIYVLNAFVNDAPNSIITSLGSGMAEAGWDVMYVAWSRSGPLAEELVQAGARTVVLGKGFLGGALELRRLIQEVKPDIVHASLARPILGVALSKVFCGRFPVIWIASDHGIHEWHEKGRLIGATMELLMPPVLASMDAVITVSESASADLAKRGLNAESVHVIPNGVDVRRFYPRPTGIRSQFLSECFPANTEAAGTFLIGSAGNLRALKGFDLLITAMKAVVEAFPNARLVIWGEGPEQKALDDYAQSHLFSRANFICFAGYDKHLEDRLPLLDLYVQPSRVESFGLAAAEAMACGVPVVVSDAGGLKSLVIHGQSGLIFPVDDLQKLTEEILYMINNQRQRMRMASEGRLRVLQHFTQLSMVRKVEDLYVSLLRGNGGAA